jgi:antimicrobial peptide system SdpB family protein
MLEHVGQWAIHEMTRHHPWNCAYGLARSTLAASTALTLLFNSPHTLFRPSIGQYDVPSCSADLMKAGLFCLVPRQHLWLTPWLASAVLLVVASGWRPRLTALPHWWITLSFQMNAVVTDGGDQLAAVLTMLLLPVALADSRRWHWQWKGNSVLLMNAPFLGVSVLAALFLIRLQVAGVYFHSAAGKFAVAEWANGTAVYYWLTHESYGGPPWLMPALMPFLTTGFSIGMITWSVVLVEFVLAAGLFVPRRHWNLLFMLGMALHGSILVIHGLVSFSLVMMAALFLYVSPSGQTGEFFARRDVQATPTDRQVS